MCLCVREEPKLGGGGGTEVHRARKKLLSSSAFIMDSPGAGQQRRGLSLATPDENH